MPISNYNYNVITNLLQTKNLESFQDIEEFRWSVGLHLQHRNLIAKVVRIFSCFRAYFPQCLIKFYMAKVNEIEGQYRIRFNQEIKAIHPNNRILPELENQPIWFCPELYKKAFLEAKIAQAARNLNVEFKPAFIAVVSERLRKRSLQPTEADLKAECIKMIQSAPAPISREEPELALYQLQDCIDKYIDKAETIELYLTKQDVMNSGLPLRGDGKYFQTMSLREERLAAIGEYYLEIRALRAKGEPFPDDLLLKLHLVGTIASLLKSFECPSDYAKWALRHVFDNLPTQRTIAITLFRERGDDFQTKEESPWRMHLGERPQWLESLFNSHQL